MVKTSWIKTNGLIKLTNYFPLPIVMTNKQKIIDLLVMIALCLFKTNEKGEMPFSDWAPE